MKYMFAFLAVFLCVLSPADARQSDQASVLDAAISSGETIFDAKTKTLDNGLRWW